MAELNPEQSAKLIFDNGPLTRAELKKLSHDRAYEYFQVMSHFLKELGEKGFLAKREELRQAALERIVNRPDAVPEPEA